jgi:hypothetical protein
MRRLANGASPGMARVRDRAPPPVEGIDQAVTLAGVDALISIVGPAAGEADATRAERLRAAAELRALHSLRARIQRQADLDATHAEGALVRTSAWQAVRRAIIGALREHPGALAAVAEAGRARKNLGPRTGVRVALVVSAQDSGPDSRTFSWRRAGSTAR